MQAADYYTKLSKEYDTKKKQLLYYYNYVMSDGKWEDILTPESFTPPPMALYPVCKPALVIEEPGLGVFCEDDCLTFEELGRPEKFFIIYNTGCGKITYTIEAPEWLTLSKTSGTLQTEQRIVVNYSGEFAFNEKQGVIKITSEAATVELPVTVLSNPFIHTVQAQDAAYFEADGYISMDAAKYHLAGQGIHLISHLGRGSGDVIESSGDALSWVTYAFYAKTSGTFLLELHRFLTLRPNEEIRFELSIDNQTPLLISSAITDEWQGTWRNSVMNNGEKLFLQLPELSTGLHHLTVKMPDKYTAISKIVIYTKERKNSNLGPDYSFYLRDTVAEPKKEPVPTIDTCAFTYAQTPDIPPALPMLYANREFWNIDRLYIKSEERPEQPAQPVKYSCDAAGRKNVFAEFGSGKFLEQNNGICIEVEYALENSDCAYTSKSSDNTLEWSHTQSETNGGKGMAMLVDAYDVIWHTPADAPSLNFVLNLAEAGLYHVWMLVKFDDDRTDSCYLALDGQVQDLNNQFGRGNFFTYSMKQRWNWRELSDLYIPEGTHTLSILARKAGLRIDRIYLTKTDNYPPTDKDFQPARKTPPITLPTIS